MLLSGRLQKRKAYSWKFLLSDRVTSARDSSEVIGKGRYLQDVDEKTQNSNIDCKIVFPKKEKWKSKGDSKLERKGNNSIAKGEANKGCGKRKRSMEKD